MFRGAGSDGASEELLYFLPIWPSAHRPAFLPRTPSSSRLPRRSFGEGIRPRRIEADHHLDESERDGRPDATIAGAASALSGRSIGASRRSSCVVAALRDYRLSS